MVTLDSAYPVTRGLARLELRIPYLNVIIGGTFDEIIDLLSFLTTAVYSWPIVNGHSDWYEEPVTTITEEGFTSDATAESEG